MKKKILPMFFLLSLAMGLCIAVSGCSALKLKAPANLRVSDDGFLSWDEVDGAAAYRVFINDGVFDTDENRLDIFWLTDSYGEYLIDVVALDAKNRIKSESSELFEYDLQDSGGWTLQYNGESYDVAGTEDSKNVVSGKVILPSVYNDLPVTGIADAAFMLCKNLTSVIIPDSITEIGQAAFNRCTSLARAELPRRLKSLESIAFGDCKTLTELKIPKTVQYISGKMINGCNGITTLEIEEGNEIYESQGNCIVRKADRQLVCGTKNCEIPENIASVGENAFYKMDIEKLSLPKGVESIGTAAFQNCEKLKELCLPDGLKTIGSRAFSGCAFDYVSIPMSVESIGGDAFNFFHGLSVTLPKSVKKLGANAFDKYVTIYTDLKHDENYPEDWKLPETQMDSSFIYSFDSYAPAFPVKRRIITDCVFVCEDGVPYVDSFNPEHNLDSDAGNSDNPYQVPGRAGYVFGGWADGNGNVVWHTEFHIFQKVSGSAPSSSGADLSYTPKSKYILSLSGPAGEIPSGNLLYAVWTPAN